MLRKIYVISGAAALTLYGALAFTGWEYGTPTREKLDPSVRDSPAGYRTHFTYVGSRGGK
jgi:hypothetical protein